MHSMAPLKLEVDKNSTTLHLIFVVLGATICMFHEHYEIKSFWWQKKLNIFRSVRCSDHFGHCKSHIAFCVGQVKRGRSQTGWFLTVRNGPTGLYIGHR